MKLVKDIAISSWFHEMSIRTLCIVSIFMLHLVIVHDCSSAQNQQLIVVTRDQAPVKVGEKVLTRVRKGARLTVTRTQGDWHYVTALVNGQTFEGWVHQTHVRLEPHDQQAEGPLSESEKEKLIAEAQSLRDQADQLWDEGKKKEGIPLNRKAVAIRTRVLGKMHVDTAEALAALGRSLHAQQQLDQAIDSFQQALAIRMDVLGEDHEQTGWTHYFLCQSLLVANKPKLAHPHAAKSLVILREVFGESHFNTGSAHAYLAWAHDMLGGAATARTHYEHALTIHREQLGEKHEDTIWLLSKIANMSMKQKEFEVAKEQFERLLPLQRELYGEDSLQCSETFNLLAHVLSSLQELPAAKQHAERALEIYEQVNGSQNRSVVILLQNLGAICEQMADYPAARSCFRRALTICEDAVGEKDALTAGSHYCLARVHVELENHETAKVHYQNSLAIYQSLYGDNHDHTGLTYNDIGAQFSRLGKFVEAKRYYEKALRVFRAIHNGPHKNTALTLHNLGVVSNTLDEFEKARDYLQQALAMRKEVLGDADVAVASTLVSLAILAHNTGDFESAQTNYQQALDLQKKVFGMGHHKTIDTRHRLGTLMCKIGDFAAAERHLKQAMELCMQLREVNDYPRSDLDLAESFKLWGTLLAITGDYAGARKYLEQSLGMYEEQLGPRHPEVASSLSFLAVYLSSIGDAPAARGHLERALTIRRETLGENHTEVASLHNELGSTLNDPGDFRDAQAHFEKALAIYRNVLGEKNAETALVLNNLAVLLDDLGRNDEARKYLEQVHMIYHDLHGEGHNRTLAALRNLAFLLTDSGDYETCRRYLEKALDGTRVLFGDQHPETAETLNGIGLANAALGNIEAARAGFDECRKIYRRHIFEVLSTLSESEQLRFVQSQNVQNSFNLAMSFAVYQRNDEATRALSAEWLLNGKAVTHESLAQRMRRDGPVAAPLINELRIVRNSIARNRVADSASSELEALRRKETQLVRELGELTAEHPTSDQWIPLADVRNELNNKALLVNVAYFRYFDYQKNSWTHDRYVAWLIPSAAQGDIQVVDLGPADAIDRSINQVRDALQLDPKELGESGEIALEKQALAPLRHLSSLVLAPLESHLGDVEELILSPDALLWLAPWSALTLETGEYLLEKYRLSYLVSGRELVEQRTKSAEARSPVIIADPDYDVNVANHESPKKNETALERSRAKEDHTRSSHGLRGIGKVLRLPASASEAKAIKPSLDALSGKTTLLYLGHRASEDAFKTLESPRVLVLSTHGFFLKDQQVKRSDRLRRSSDARPTTVAAQGELLENPLLRCGLLFAGCNTREQATGADVDDGVLTGLEIAGAELRGTEMVVLSACDTGVGEVRNGEGVAGLRQAFQLAGAKSVVSTLWQIPDRATAQLMNDFFKHLAAGQDKATALRAAQLTRIQSRRDRYGAAHPFFWAAFTLTGVQ